MVRIATFNAENLFARYRFQAGKSPVGKDGFTVEQMEFDDLDKEGRTRLKALAIREANADIVCLQEIDSLPALDWFVSKFLGGCRYHHRLLIDGNDRRQIDVAVLSRFEIVAARSHRHERIDELNTKLFSRDCLEVEIDVGGKPLWICNNHNKSMSGGRAATSDLRRRQVRKIVEIFDRAARSGKYDGNLVILGDFNDYVENTLEDPKSSLGPLLTHPDLVDVIGTRVADPNERYTYFFGGADISAGELPYTVLDRLLVARSLAEAPANAARRPGFVRNGMGYQVDRYKGARFQGVGSAMPTSSDHSLVMIDLDLL